MVNYKFRKKPVVIEAFQMTLERRWDNSEWPNWLHAAWQQEPGEGGVWIDPDAPVAEGRESADKLVCGTLEGVHRIDFGDYIICGIKGEIYPCKPDIFEATYEPVVDDRAPLRETKRRQRVIAAMKRVVKEHGRMKLVGESSYTPSGDIQVTVRFEFDEPAKAIDLIMAAVEEPVDLHAPDCQCADCLGWRP